MEPTGEIIGAPVFATFFGCPKCGDEKTKESIRITKEFWAKMEKKKVAFQTQKEKVQQ